MSERFNEAVRLGWMSPCPPWPHKHAVYSMDIDAQALEAAKEKLKPSATAFLDHTKSLKDSP